MTDSSDKQRSIDPADAVATDATMTAPRVWKPEASPGAAPDTAARPKELGGREGPEPTRFGDWERNGRCIDF